MPHAGCGNGLRFTANLFKGQMTPRDAVLARKCAVRTAVIAVVRNVQGREQKHHAAEILSGERACFLRDWLQKGSGGRREQCKKVQRPQLVSVKNRFHLLRGDGIEETGKIE